MNNYFWPLWQSRLGCGSCINAQAFLLLCIKIAVFYAILKQLFQPWCINNMTRYYNIKTGNETGEHYFAQWIKDTSYAWLENEVKKWLFLVRPLPYRGHESTLHKCTELWTPGGVRRGGYSPRKCTPPLGWHCQTPIGKNHTLAVLA